MQCYPGTDLQDNARISEGICTAQFSPRVSLHYNLPTPGGHFIYIQIYVEIVASFTILLMINQMLCNKNIYRKIYLCKGDSRLELI